MEMHEIAQKIRIKKPNYMSLCFMAVYENCYFNVATRWKRKQMRSTMGFPHIQTRHILTYSLTHTYHVYTECKVSLAAYISSSSSSSHVRVYVCIVLYFIWYALLTQLIGCLGWV